MSQMFCVVGMMGCSERCLAGKLVNVRVSLSVVSVPSGKPFGLGVRHSNVTPSYAAG
jgi:hypothetical protein